MNPDNLPLNDLPSFKKILVANRGEIAVRAFRAAFETGAKTVAVFPREDRNSFHRPFADEAVLGLVVDLAAGDAERLPPPEALQARLNGVLIPRIPVAAGFQPLPLVVAALTTT